ncbi:transposase [Variovorax paradoxus]|uniref:Transposase n=1 Tax=Variovorax paradoxus TaxID=34073 RepID=A0AAW8ES31_VARPD|nr:transposase [Variovorax paradoxus]MDP9975224.1 transposase [Variovorax paradoxus]
MDMMANGQEVRRRRYSEELKQQVLSECERPNASVAKVAMAHGINANVVHSWRKKVRESLETPDAIALQEPTFVPMMLPPVASAVSASPRQIQVQIKRGAVVISVDWPLEAAAQLGIWTREFLK